MKKLHPYEYRWIAKRPDGYGIRYAEIYDEVYDHVVSAAECQRRQGDMRSISTLFQETIGQDLGGKDGLARITAERKALLKSKLQGALRTALRPYFGSSKVFVFVGLGVLAYGVATLSDMTPHHLALGAFVVSVVPLLFLLGWGSGQGYFRAQDEKDR